MGLVAEALESVSKACTAYFVSTLILIYFIYQYYRGGLHRYPGPFLANFTDAWRFVDSLGRRPEATQIRLHRQYGDVVRLGPNALSFGNPKALKVIYGLNKGFTKSNFYPVQMANSRGEYLPSLFSTQDELYHANLRRSVNNAFSMSSLVQYEPMVDDTISVFLDQTDRLYAATDKVCDFARWLQFFAFDVIGSITYSRRHGFVDKNEDIDGIIKSLARIFDYSGPVGQMPWLDKVFWKNPILRQLTKWGLWDTSSGVAVFARARMQERTTGTIDETTKPTIRDDLLSMFMRARENRPDFMTQKQVLTMAVSMAFAGSETTAISLSSVFYHLFKNQETLTKLREELDAAVQSGSIENRPTGIVSWSESQHLPYLDACVKEALRLHPAAGLPLERVVPEQGMDIAGHWVSGGTIVGCNAWVIHRREDLFGADVDSFRPERWLEADGERVKVMNGNMFQFGAGSRTCIGKNISLMEIYKLVPSLLRRFDVSLAYPDREWTLHNAWFVRQLNFMTTFAARRVDA